MSGKYELNSMLLKIMEFMVHKLGDLAGPNMSHVRKKHLTMCYTQILT